MLLLEFEWKIPGFPGSPLHCISHQTLIPAPVSICGSTQQCTLTHHFKGWLLYAFNVHTLNGYGLLCLGVILLVLSATTPNWQQYCMLALVEALARKTKNQVVTNMNSFQGLHWFRFALKDTFRQSPVENPTIIICQWTKWLVMSCQQCCNIISYEQWG